MRKLVMLTVLMICALSVVGCRSKKGNKSKKTESEQTSSEENSNSNEQNDVDMSGIYTCKYMTEYVDNNTEETAYLILNKDNTGAYIVQNDVKITWDDSAIYTELGETINYTYDKDKKVVTLDENGKKKEYVFSDEELPAEIKKRVEEIEKRVPVKKMVENNKSTEEKDGATKKSESSNKGEAKAGIYVCNSNYLILKEDYTGYHIVKDGVKITWDSASIRAEGSSIQKYTYDANKKTIILDGQKYVLSTKKLPDNINKIIKELDNKITKNTSTAETTKESSKKDISGTYFREYKEEFEGEVGTYRNYLILNKDHTGYIIVQDYVKITWDDSKINMDDGSYNYKYDESKKTITIDNEEYKFLSSGIPNEVKKLLE